MLPNTYNIIYILLSAIDIGQVTAFDKFKDK